MINGTHSNAELFSDLSVQKPFPFQQLPDLIHLVLVELVRWCIFPASVSPSDSPWSVPSTRNHIVSVIGIRAKFQVVWIAARRIIAAVLNLKRFRNLAVRNQPCKSVCVHRFLGSHSKDSIATLCSTGLKHPAIVRPTHFDLFPKSNLCRFGGFVHPVIINNRLSVSSISYRSFQWP